MDTKPNELLWVEKYRPSKVADCILPQKAKAQLLSMVKQGSIQNLMLTGNAGIGKTTIALALCNELQMDKLMINCSKDGNIDTIRNMVTQFASSMSLSGDLKCVVFDEADGLTQVAQQALRNFIEEFSQYCRFIFTANYANKIIEPLHSRTTNVDLSVTKTDKIEMAKSVIKRLLNILENEDKQVDIAVIKDLIKRHFPDMRKIINQLQNLAMNGMTGDIFTGAIDTETLFKMLKEKQFTELRKFVTENPDYDLPIIGRMLYNGIDEYLNPGSIPQFILHYNDYQVKQATVIDKEINLIAFLIELMADLEFK